ncbi:MAG: hypothetical protein AB8B63_01925 [Granulosicoccus sp.]
MKYSRQLMYRHLMMLTRQKRFLAADGATTRRGWQAWLLAFVLALPTYSLAQTGSQDCRCRAPGGGMRDLGTVECVDIVGTRYLVVCVMSTNTPYWKRIDYSDGCPAA